MGFYGEKWLSLCYEKDWILMWFLKADTAVGFGHRTAAVAGDALGSGADATCHWRMTWLVHPYAMPIRALSVSYVLHDA